MMVRTLRTATSSPVAVRSQTVPEQSTVCPPAPLRPCPGGEREHYLDFQRNTFPDHSPLRQPPSSRLGATPPQTGRAMDHGSANRSSVQPSGTALDPQTMRTTRPVTDNPGQRAPPSPRSGPVRRWVFVIAWFSWEPRRAAKLSKSVRPRRPCDPETTDDAHGHRA